MTYIKQRLEDTDWQILVFKTVLFIWVVSLPFKNAVYQISFVMLDLFFITHLLCTQNFGIIKDILYKTRFLGLAFAGILLSMVISNLLNPDFIGKKAWETSFLFVFRYGMIFIALTYFYMLDFFNQKEIKYAIIAGPILLAATAIIYIIQNPNILFNIDLHLTGSLNSRTMFGLFMGIGFICSFIFIKNSILKGILSISFIFLIIFSFARSSWVASAVAIFIFFILNIKTITKKDIVMIIVFGIFLLLLYFSFTSFQERFEKLISMNSTHRIDMWLWSIDIIKQHVFFGYGLGNFLQLPNNYFAQHHIAGFSHNIFIDILLSTGIFGMFFYIQSIFLTLIKALKNNNIAIFSILIYMIVVSQFDFGAYGQKEFLSFIVIFTFLAYCDDFKEQN